VEAGGQSGKSFSPGLTTSRRGAAGWAGVSPGSIFSDAGAVFSGSEKVATGAICFSAATIFGSGSAAGRGTRLASASREMVEAAARSAFSMRANSP